MINSKFFHSLPQDIQEAIKKAARVATEYQRQRSIEDEAKYKKILKEKMQFTELTRRTGKIC